MTPRHSVLHIQGCQVCKLHHFKACYFGVLLTSILNFDISTSPPNDMHMLIPDQGAHTHIFLSPPLAQMAWCSITPKYRHVHKHNIYKFICMSTMNMKYLSCPSCIGCTLMHSNIQQVHKIYKREVHTFHKVMQDFPSKPGMCIHI